LARFLAGVFWNALDLRVESESGLECTLRNRSDWLAFQEIFVRREYESAVDLALARYRFEKEFRVLDLGANIGLFTLYTIDRALTAGVDAGRLRVLAIEGNPTTYQRLDPCVRAWRRSVPGLESVHGLVGKRSGVARIEDGWGHLGNAVLPDGEKGAVVSYFNLEERCAELGGIDLLKCDIEGSECAFLDEYPSLIASCSVAVIEFHGRGPMEHGRARMQALGFEPAGRRRCTTTPEGEVSLETFVSCSAPGMRLPRE